MPDRGNPGRGFSEKEKAWPISACTWELPSNSWMIPSTISLKKRPGKDHRQRPGGRKSDPALDSRLADVPPADRERLSGIIQNQNRSEEDLRYVMQRVQDLAGIDFTVKRAAAYVEQAQAALSPFPSSPEKEALLAVSDYTLKRKK